MHRAWPTVKSLYCILCTHAGKGGETITTVTTLTQPEGELLLGLPTLLTTHRVNVEVKRTQNKPKRLNNPMRVIDNLKRLIAACGRHDSSCCTCFVICEKENREWRMRDHGTTQNKPKRLRQPCFNAQTTQTQAQTSPSNL